MELLDVHGQDGLNIKLWSNIEFDFPAITLKKHLNRFVQDLLTFDPVRVVIVQMIKYITASDHANHLIHADGIERLLTAQSP